jgi:cytochrome b561
MTTLVNTSAATSRSTYSRVSITLHWLIAFMIMGSMTSGILHKYVDEATAADLMKTHMPAGFTILLLSVLRVGWRVANGFPNLPMQTQRLDVRIARATHVALYLLMIGIPLAGWLAASGRGGFSYFGLFEIAPLPVSESVARVFADAHAALAMAMFALIALHIAGALKHHFIDRDDVLVRMLPLLRPRSGPKRVELSEATSLPLVLPRDR